MNNVVQFPKEKRGGPPQNLEEIQSNIDAVRQLHVEETVSLLAGVIFDNLSLAGFNFNPDNESYTKDVALTFEALKSMLYRYHGMHYPMQDVAEDIFILQEDGSVVFNNGETKEEEI